MHKYKLGRSDGAFWDPKIAWGDKACGLLLLLAVFAIGVFCFVADPILRLFPTDAQDDME